MRLFTLVLSMYVSAAGIFVSLACHPPKVPIWYRLALFLLSVSVPIFDWLRWRSERASIAVNGLTAR